MVSEEINNQLRRQSLPYDSPWSRQQPDMTQWLNNKDSSACKQGTEEWFQN